VPLPAQPGKPYSRAINRSTTEHWRSPLDTPLAAGGELTVLATRQGLAEALSQVERSDRPSAQGAVAIPP